MEKRINLYDDKYYKKEKVNLLFRYYDETKEIKIFQNYIKGITNADTILRVLGDCIAKNLVNGMYKYNINSGMIKTWFGYDDSCIEEAISEATGKTDGASFVKELWNKYIKCPEKDQIDTYTIIDNNGEKLENI